MTPEERRRILGDDAIEDADRQAHEAITFHPPAPELIARLRLIFTRPGGLAVAETRDAA